MSHQIIILKALKLLFFFNTIALSNSFTLRHQTQKVAWPIRNNNLGAAADVRPVFGMPSGKGDYTIKVIHSFTSLVIDPEASKDKSFWSYLLVVSQWLKIDILKINTIDTSSCSDALIREGVDEADVAYFSDLFSLNTVCGPPTSTGALVINSRNLTPEIGSRGWGKIISVGESPLFPVDIEVGSLGELRALSICSYATLTKKC